MKDIQTTQETSGALQSEVCEREGEMEKQTQGEDAPASLPRTQPPSVHFFQSITDLDTTVLPSSSSWSLSTEMHLSYSLSSPQISAVNTPTIAPKALKSTVVNHSQSESSMEVNSFIISKKMTPFHDDSEPAVTGEGEDYFLSLFGDSNKLTAHSSQTKKTWKHFTMILEEMSQSRSSALGDIKIAEVNTKGLFIKLINSSVDKELEIGNHILQQKVNGRTVSLYRFLSNITMQANSTVTVWAAASEAKHQPPSDFLWKEANKFRSSPDCTTILCKPNGEAIAWYTPIHWMQAWEKLETDIEFERCSVTSPTSQEYIFHSPEVTTTTKKIHQPKKNTSKHQMGPVQVFLKREKDAPPTLFPNCSPWCSSPDVPPHPYCPLIEPLNTSMSRSSINRQRRPHSARLDPFQVLQGPKKSGYLSYKSNR